MSALRIYDSDVTMDPNLEVVARTGLRRYRGNWGALIRQKVADQHGEPIPVRQVLNMLLALGEPAITQMIAANIHLDRPRPHNHDDASRYLATRPERPRRPRLESVETRRVVVETKAKVNVDFARPAVWNGKWHRIDHQHTYMRWHVESGPFGGWLWEEPRYPVLHLRWACDKISNNRNIKYEFAKFQGLLPPQQKCRGCFPDDIDPRSRLTI